MPPIDPTTGGLRPGVTEAFPNGGGNRAFLFVADGPGGRFTWFFQNSVSLSDISTPIVVGGVDYGAPIENLKAALKAEGLSSVDCGSEPPMPGSRVCCCPFWRPKAYLPVHWDGLYGALKPASRGRMQMPAS